MLRVGGGFFFFGTKCIIYGSKPVLISAENQNGPVVFLWLFVVMVLVTQNNEVAKNNY